MKTAQQAKLIRNVEYHLEDSVVKVPSGTVVNFHEDAECAYVSNMHELFHCQRQHVEPFTGKFTLVSDVSQLMAPTPA